MIIKLRDRENDGIINVTGGKRHSTVANFECEFIMKNPGVRERVGDANFMRG